MRVPIATRYSADSVFDVAVPDLSGCFSAGGLSGLDCDGSLLNSNPVSPDPLSDVTRTLKLMGSGDPESADDLLPLVYDELRQLAAARMSDERAGHTLQATALVHEAWIKLAGADGEDSRWTDRHHFYAAAAEAMRRILIDHARRKMTARRGGDWLRITFGDHEAPRSATPPEMIDLSNALDRLAEIDEEKAEVAKLRLFGGLTVVEIASALDVSEATIKRRWSYVKAWLSRELKRDDAEAGKT